jgi:hypothetical protein
VDAGALIRPAGDNGLAGARPGRLNPPQCYLRYLRFTRKLVTALAPPGPVTTTR